MSLISEMKEIADLAKQLGNIELYKKIIALELEIIDLTRENRSLKEKLEESEKRQNLKDQMRFENPFYYREGDDVPHCQRCWEVDHRAVHVSGPSEMVSGTTYRCRQCRHTFVTRKNETALPQRRRRY